MKNPLVIISNILKNKKTYQLVAASVLSFSVHAQNYDWAKSAGGSSGDIANSIAVDAAGNSYITGWFQGTATFGSTTLTSGGDYDYYIAKYNASGNLVWAKSGGSTGNDIGYSVVVDNSNNVYVTGTFSSSLTLGTTTLTASATTGNIFIAKYDSSGAVLWTQKGTGADEAQGQGIAVDASGNCYITGYFKGSLSIGTNVLTGGSGSATSAIFVIKLDVSGNITWTKQNALGQCNAYDIACDNVGNAYVTGYFVGSVTLGTNTLTGSGLFDMYVTKITSSGTFEWAKSGGGTSIDQGNRIAIDGSNNIYVTGYYTGSSTFSGTPLTSVGSSADVFIAKYKSDGTLTWVKSAGGTQADIASGIDADANGNIFITGYYQGSTTFGTAPAITSNGAFDIFAAKYDSSGNCKWASGAGGSNGDYGYAIKAKSGKVYIAGSFSGSATFGSSSLTSAGADDIYLAKLSDTTGSSSSVIAINNNTTIVCYPNPAKNILHVTLLNAAHTSYVIYDIWGRRIINGQLHASGNIDCSMLTNGVYALEVKQNNTVLLREQITICK